MEFTTEKLITAYIKLRDAIAEKEKEHKAELKGLHEQLDLIEQELLVHCEKAGGNISVPGVGRGASGPAIRSSSRDTDDIRSSPHARRPRAGHPGGDYHA